MTNPKKKYATAKELLESGNYPLSRSMLRRLTARREDNGLSEVTKRLGNKIYYDIALFSKWIEKNALN